MKKSVVAILVLLAVVVLISPAIVGRLAERSMDENIEWAARESGEVTVTSESFDRGWFSSAGQHRIELQDGELLNALQVMAGPLDPADLPVLIVKTRLDHGLIPLGSLGREGGSLAPGLGSAVSTLVLELPDGETFEIPGTIYSKVALNGALQSNYLLAAGTHEQADTSASWGDVDIEVTSNPSTGHVLFAGSVDSVTIVDSSQTVTLGAFSIAGDQRPTDYGFSVGEVSYAIDGATVQSGTAAPAGLKSLSADVTTELVGDRVNGNIRIGLATETMPDVGNVTVETGIRISGVAAAALGGMQQSISDMTPSQEPAQLYLAIEDDLRAMFASGFEVTVEQLDVGVPQGVVSARMHFDIDATDPDSFDWTSLLTGTRASVDISVPESMLDTILETNPQAGVVVGMGYLLKNGDVYEMKAELKKGLLTINGAPMPLPLGGTL